MEPKKIIGIAAIFLTVACLGVLTVSFVWFDKSIASQIPMIVVLALCNVAAWSDRPYTEKEKSR